MIRQRIEGRSRKGFTLIELLVVIAIIAILAAILFPVFAQAREKARAVTCLSNQKQIGLAVLMYAQDYDEYIVPWLTCCSTTGGTGSAAYDAESNQRLWVGKLQPYMKLGLGWGVGGQAPKGAFACPSWTAQKWEQASDAADCDGNGTPGSGGLAAWLAPKAPDYPHVFANYGIAFQSLCLNDGSGNCFPACGTPSLPCWNPPGSLNYPVASGGWWLALPAVQRPSETAIVSDGITLVEPGLTFGITFGCEASLMHQNGGNYVFLDGHAKHISGNAQRYESKRASDGMVYQTYFTYSE